MLKGSNTPVPATALHVEVGRRHGPGVPGASTSALLLAAGKVRSAADVVHRDRPAHPSGAVRHAGERARGPLAVETLSVDLPRVEAAIERIVFAVSADGGTFGQVPDLYIEVSDPVTGRVAARFDEVGASVETTLLLGELYRRQGGWKFRAVGQGYDNGPEGLAAAFGGTADASRPAAGRPAPPARPSRVTLTKSAPSVSLAKQGGTSGVLRVNLNWQARQGFSGRGSHRGGGPGDVDLDLCALYELADGRKGVVQALGNSFGSLHRPPYIHLDGDDRTGAAEGGENLTLNLDHRRELRRVLVFVTVYEGATSFAGLHATVTLRPQHGAPVDFALDECTVPSTVCALALITDDGGDLVVRREARYLVPERGVSPQRTVDRAYGWGMNWTPGRK
ncbi:Tellurium resistance [Streptomyces misionensis]|uniref:Tellurium resistance n=1 Tax=Streptomyces misionensis TaxID=67331 RepID=A0A5C6IPV7_9ACTN|nr:TerD family protein [Streptomyces misionensis]TWV31309.1 Tellurium resistance [Streptomyces misionensis]